MKKILLVVGLVVVLFIGGVGFFAWRAYQKFMEVDAVKQDPQLTIYYGAGNSIVLYSEDGVKALIVDTKMGSAAKKLAGTVTAREITIVYTHSHSDHTGGNALYPSAKIIAGAYGKKQWEGDSDGARYPDIVVKPGEKKILQIGRERVHVRNMGRAHTWNDVVVYCENRRLLVTGDIVFSNMHPALLLKSGTRVASWISVLDRLYNDYKTDLLVPGHGRGADRRALTEMKDYFVSIGEAIGDPEKQATFKAKYKDYYSLPLMSGLGRTMKFIENERKSQ